MVCGCRDRHGGSLTRSKHRSRVTAVPYLALDDNLIQEAHGPDARLVDGVPDEAVRALERAARSLDAECRGEAALLLGRIAAIDEDPSAPAWLRAALVSPDDQVIAEATANLARLLVSEDPEAAVCLAERALGSEDPQVLGLANIVLASLLAEEDAKPYLAAALASDHPEVRAIAADL